MMGLSNWEAAWVILGVIVLVAVVTWVTLDLIERRERNRLMERGKQRWP